MSELHRFVGYVLVGVVSIGWLFGLGLWLARRQAGDWFWRWLVASQLALLVQSLVGLVLLVAGRTPTTWLHHVYGFGPLVVFAVAHLLAREEAFGSNPWVPFAMASFISFGLSLRALTTGLGIG